ncbi:MAG: flagellar basal body rod C-terminal domain-containing protein [Candidatus Gastranaerophilales bacterium]|nr:flagellar basal body rod C-terminal domain-containing protein [Candidatus Gastranaerophilales bacterium]
MTLNGGIRFINNGLKTSIRAMQVQSTLIDIANDNIEGFDKVGYQRKEAITSAFTEYLGVNGISTTADDKVGRIANTGNPLDLALATKGYFQIQSEEGIKLTRDGRFKLDKEGNLLTLEGAKVLSESGMPIKLSVIPENLKHVVVNSKGGLSVFNKATNKLEHVANIGVVDSNGILLMRPEVKQGYNEYSNVSLEREFLGMMAPLKAFDANRQIFMIENSNLAKTISQLGSAS